MFRLVEGGIAEHGVEVVLTRASTKKIGNLPISVLLPHREARKSDLLRTSFPNSTATEVDDTDAPTHLQHIVAPVTGYLVSRVNSRIQVVTLKRCAAASETSRSPRVLKRGRQALMVLGWPCIRSLIVGSRHGGRSR